MVPCIIHCFIRTLHLFTVYHGTVYIIIIGTTRVVHHLCYLCFVLCTVIFNVSAKQVNLCADCSFKAFFSYHLVIATCFSSILNFYCLLCLIRDVFVPFVDCYWLRRWSIHLLLGLVLCYIFACPWYLIRSLFSIQFLLSIYLCTFMVTSVSTLEITSVRARINCMFWRVTPWSYPWSTYC